MRKSLSLQDAIKESSRCLLCEDAPCSKDCPAGTDPAKFIRQIRFQNYKGAARTVRNNNILGAVCAFTCPVEKLCEKNCTSAKLGSSIDISGLQRFACEYGDKSKLESVEKAAKRKEKVAVIGSGPAGLACASELLRAGFSVTIFEKEKEIGGVPNWGVPSYRLPKEALQNSIAELNHLGVEIKLKSAIDSEDDVNALLAKGFSAVFVATGLSKSVNLDLLSNFQNVISANEFLRAVKKEELKFNLTDKRVAVIGGGSVAMDAAVTAKNLGAKSVCTISLEHLNELPADEEEQELARKAGVVFKPGAQITDVVSDNDKIVCLKGTETEWKEKGNFSPANAVPVHGSDFNLKTDVVIQAIGARAELKIAEKPGIFIGGDLVGGGTIAKAVGDGKKAAEKIKQFIG